MQENKSRTKIHNTQPTEQRNLCEIRIAEQHRSWPIIIESNVHLWIMIDVAPIAFAIDIVMFESSNCSVFLPHRINYLFYDRSRKHYAREWIIFSSYWIYTVFFYHVSAQSTAGWLTFIMIYIDWSYGTIGAIIVRRTWHGNAAERWHANNSCDHIYISNKEQQAAAG